MNYGNYNGYNYMQNYMTPNYQQMNFNRPQPVIQQPVEQPFQIVKFVNETEANGFIVDPNCRVLLIDKTNKKFWIKWADAMGESQQEVFKFESINNSKIENQDMSVFVKKEELTNFLTKDDLKDFEEKLDKLQKELKK